MNSATADDNSNEISVRNEMATTHDSLPTLTNNFFEQFLNNQNFDEDTKPVLQILKIVPAAKLDWAPYRLHCSDGALVHITCGLQKSLVDQVKRQSLEARDNFPIIKVLNFQKVESQTSSQQMFLITKYELLCRYPKVLNKPKDSVTNVFYEIPIKITKRKSTEEIETTNRKIYKPDNSNTLPINAITPYFDGRWRICGIVSSREPIREIINKKKETKKLFSFILVDKYSSEIKITAFEETAEKFNDIVKENSTLIISGAPSCIRKKITQYNSTKHDYEITLSASCEISESNDIITPEKNNPENMFDKPVPLNLLDAYFGKVIDIIAVIDKIDNMTMVQTTKKATIERRIIHLVDRSETSAILTLWGQQAIDFKDNVGDVICIKNAIIREYNKTYSLAVNLGCRILINPKEIKETSVLSEWFKEDRPKLKIKPATVSEKKLSPEDFRFFSSFSQSNKAVRESGSNGVYFSSCSMITEIRTDNAIYKACAHCTKKLSMENDKYYCSKCNRYTTSFNYKYMVPLCVSDICSSIWFTLFDEQAQGFFGITATELGNLNNDEVMKRLHSKLFTIHNFRFRAKTESYNDIEKIRIQVFDIRPLTVHYNIALEDSLKMLEDFKI